MPSHLRINKGSGDFSAKDHPFASKPIRLDEELALRPHMDEVVGLGDDCKILHLIEVEMSRSVLWVDGVVDAAQAGHVLEEVGALARFDQIGRASCRERV